MPTGSWSRAAIHADEGGSRFGGVAVGKESTIRRCPRWERGCRRPAVDNSGPGSKRAQLAAVRPAAKRQRLSPGPAQAQASALAHALAPEPSPNNNMELQLCQSMDSVNTATTEEEVSVFFFFFVWSVHCGAVAVWLRRG